MNTTLRLSEIQIGNRHRQEMGDIDALAQSIGEIGLLHPIVVDMNHRLVAGQRRLKAVEQLGWTEIPARILDIEEIVFGELAENEMRKDFTVSERVAIGRAIEASIGERRGRPSSENVQKSAQLEIEKGQKTRDVAAERAGFGNAETYRQAKLVIDTGTPELVDAMDAGEVSIGVAKQLAALPLEEQRARVAESRGVTRITCLTGEAEWYTPPQYIAAVREVMGDIDLDPASSHLAQQNVRAQRYFTKEEDGLSQKWFKRVFLNPPFITSLIGPFIVKMVESYNNAKISEGMLLTHNSADTEWFRIAAESADATFFTKGRISFLKWQNGELVDKSSPTHGVLFRAERRKIRGGVSPLWICLAEFVGALCAKFNDCLRERNRRSVARRCGGITH